MSGREVQARTLYSQETKHGGTQSGQDKSAEVRRSIHLNTQFLSENVYCHLYVSTDPRRVGGPSGEPTIINIEELRALLITQQSLEDQTVWLTTAQAGFPGTADVTELQNERDRLLGKPVARFLHPAIVRDDPTRVLRAARYAARLEFKLADSSLLQLRQTLAAWPWPWRPGDPPEQAPAALGTRLRMELQLLLERESWQEALAALQDWGALTLLDPGLQVDRRWRRRLRWAERLGLERMVALLAAAEAPLALAERLQLPHRQQRLLASLEQLRAMFAAHGSGDGPGGALLSVAGWTQLLETPGLPAETVALALAAGLGPRRPLLRWWLRWRHLRSASSAADLIAREGLRPGPALGARLRQLRGELLNRERF